MARTANRSAGNSTRFTISFLVLLAVVVGLGTVVVYGEKGLLHHGTLMEEQRRLIEVRDQRLEENRKLYAEIQRLRGDRNYIEKVARRELGLVKENELVYIFESAEQSLPPSNR